MNKDFNKIKNDYINKYSNDDRPFIDNLKNSSLEAGAPENREMNIKDIKKSYLDVKIPDNIDKNIKDLLNNLPKDTESKKKKIYIKAASIAAGLLVAITVIITNFEQVKASLVSVFQQLSFKEVTEGIAKYDEINKYVSNGTSTIQINEVIYTPQGLIFTYTLDKELFREPDNIQMIQKEISVDLYHGLNISKVTINGEEAELKEVTGSCMINTVTSSIIGYQSIFINNLEDGDKVEVLAYKDESDSSFDMEFNVNMKVSDEDTFALEDPIIKKNDTAEIAVEELIITPSLTYIVYTLEIDQALKEDYNLGTYIVNEYGRDMYRALGTEDKMEQLSENKVRYSKYLFNSKEGANEINLIPWLALQPNKFNTFNDTEVFVSLDTDMPYIVDFGELGTVTINSVEETEESVLLNCYAEGVNKDLLLGNIYIAKSRMEELINDPSVVINFNPILPENYENIQNLYDIKDFALSFKKDGNEEYSIFYRTGFEKIYLPEDLKVNIKIK